MRIRWRGLELPSTVEQDASVLTDTYGRFVIEPFERGFGTTVGNSLRRVLLSSLEGAAVTSVKVAEAPHEFTSIPGVLEDVTDIILNVKSLVIHSESDEPKTMQVSRSEPGEVKAGDIEADPALRIVNKDLVLCTLTSETSFDMEMTVCKGRGYASADENRLPDQELGVIPVDSVFSPVLRVRYKTEDTRVGQRVNYDRLILEVWTRGTILPEDALVEAAKILRKHLNPFVMYHSLGEQVVQEGEAPAEVPALTMDSELQQVGPAHLRLEPERAGQQLSGIGPDHDAGRPGLQDRGGSAAGAEFRQDLAARGAPQAGRARSDLGHDLGRARSGGLCGVWAGAIRAAATTACPAVRQRFHPRGAALGRSLGRERPQRLAIKPCDIGSRIAS